VSELIPAVTAADHQRSDGPAAVSLVEYGDFECPFCRRAHRVVAKLAQEAGGGGPAFLYVFRNFPLVELHPHAFEAALAAEAAAAQGRYWAMHDLLFENQDALLRPDLVQYARRLRLDVDRFIDDLERRRFAFRVEADLASGEASGVTGTPTFFINGRLYHGGHDAYSMGQALAQAAAEPAVELAAGPDTGMPPG
jgi:protein-disulfide isomerase